MQIIYINTLIKNSKYMNHRHYVKSSLKRSKAQAHKLASSLSLSKSFHQPDSAVPFFQLIFSFKLRNSGIFTNLDSNIGPALGEHQRSGTSLQLCISLPLQGPGLTAPTLQRRPVAGLVLRSQSARRRHQAAGSVLKAIRGTPGRYRRFGSKSPQ